MITVKVALGAVVVHTLEESSDFIALAPDLILLRAEPLLELHLVALAVAESARGIAVRLALLGLASRARLEIQDTRYHPRRIRTGGCIFRATAWSGWSRDAAAGGFYRHVRSWRWCRRRIERWGWRKRDIGHGRRGASKVAVA